MEQGHSRRQHQGGVTVVQFRRTGGNPRSRTNLVWCGWAAKGIARLRCYGASLTGGFSDVFSSGGVVTFSQSSTSGHLTNDVVRAAVSYKFDGFPLAAGAAGGTMPLKAPARVAAWSWSGFYIGGHAGYGWGRDPFGGDPFEEFSNLTPSDINLAVSGVHSKGFLGGFQAGANWQAGAFVGGLEIDLSGPGIKGSSTASASVGTDTAIGTQTDKFDLLGSARVRLGYLPWQSTLVYGTGGLAWTRFVQIFDTTQISPPDMTVDSSSMPSWRFGWVAGAGVQNRLWNTNWLVRLEYLHHDFGNSGGFSEAIVSTGLLGAPSGSIVATTGHLTTDLVRVGFDYKLD
jgi:outer membrane immunogenic protein